MNATIAKIVNIAICVMVTADITCAVYVLAPHKGTQLYEHRTVFPSISGILYGGGSLHLRDSQCMLLRVTADDCPYCKEDTAQYKRLQQSAEDLQCALIEISPRAGQIKEASGPHVAQLQYIDMKLAEALIPYETPETVLLDRSGAVAWSHEGKISDTAGRAALKALSSMDTTLHNASLAR